jgi:hypothetical protein
MEDRAISLNAVEKITWEEPPYTDALNVLTWVRDKIRELPPVTPQIIDDIKAEIQASMDMYKGCEYIGDKARRDELWHVLEIIDKHTGKER